MADSEWNRLNPAAGDDSMDEETAAARDREMLHEGLIAMVRSMAGSLVLGAVAIILALYLLKSSYLASDQILKGKGEYWYEAYMPNVLMAMLGAGLGLFAGWRVNSSGGMMGRPGWIVAAIGVAALCVIGVIGAVIIYPSPIPTQVWVGIAAAALTTLLGVTVYTLWAP